MQQELYVIINKKRDYFRGYFQDTEGTEEGICLKEGCKKGSYFTRVFDSHRKLALWNRFQMEGQFGGMTSAAVTFYTSEKDFIQRDGQEQKIQQLIQDEGISAEQKREIFKEYLVKKEYNPRDILLMPVTGRYLWMEIELEGSKEETPVISKIKACFAKQTWMAYLPEIYQEDKESASFLERYLSIFQRIYDDMTEKIEKIPDMLNAGGAREEALEWLADWLDIEEQGIWNKEQLRYLITNALRLYEMRGTVGYLKEMVKLYAAQEPYIVEWHQVERYLNDGERGEQLEEMYSSSPYEFSIVLNEENLTSDNRFYILRKVIDMAKPAGMECRIIMLKPYIFLDQYSYLGINSVLGKYQPLALNGLCAVPFSAVSKK